MSSLGDEPWQQCTALWRATRPSREAELPATGISAACPDFPSGFTYFAQVVDHDLTLDATSTLDRRDDPNGLTNFRSPRMDLDTLCGNGPVVSPPLYDVNLLPAQLHLAFTMFHNRVVDGLRAGDITDALGRKLPSKPPAEPPDVCSSAQRLVRWHYQWIIVHEFCRWSPTPTP
jgi:hypothetical protein